MVIKLGRLLNTLWITEALVEAKGWILHGLVWLAADKGSLLAPVTVSASQQASLFIPRLHFTLTDLEDVTWYYYTYNFRRANGTPLYIHEVLIGHTSTCRATLATIDVDMSGNMSYFFDLHVPPSLSRGRRFPIILWLTVQVHTDCKNPTESTVW